MSFSYFSFVAIGKIQVISHQLHSGTVLSVKFMIFFIWIIRCVNFFFGTVITGTIDSLFLKEINKKPASEKCRLHKYREGKKIYDRGAEYFHH